MCIGSEKVDVLDGSWERAEGLDGVEAEKNASLAQKFSDGLVFEAVAADEVAGGERDEFGVFIHLAHDVHGADGSEVAYVQQTHLHAFFRKGHWTGNRRDR